MSSFVNMLGNDVWSEADIVRRTEAMIASEFPADRYVILERKQLAAMMGVKPLEKGEQQDLQRYMEVCFAAQAAGNAARADMALLAQALALEAAQELVKLPVPDMPDPPVPEPGMELATKPVNVAQEAHDAAQAVIKQATPEAVLLVGLRAPKGGEEEVKAEAAL